MKLKTAILLSFLFTSSAVSADVLVIVNAQNPVENLERKQVVDLFMGRVTAFASNQPAKTFDLPSGTPLREKFYKLLTGKSEAQIDAYWATLIFAGRMLPPKLLSDDDAMLKAVAENPSAIAYVAEQTLPPSVKVVMKLKSDQ
jgi:ABC-type phosphate transport system substrate-binding protein